MFGKITALFTRAKSWLRGEDLRPALFDVTEGPKFRRLRVEIPHPRLGYSAAVIDEESGQELSCRSIDIHCDARDFQPVLTLEVMDITAEIVGTWECRLIKEEPL